MSSREDFQNQSLKESLVLVEERRGLGAEILAGIYALEEKF